MEKIIDITKILEETKEKQTPAEKKQVKNNATNPILKQLAQFTNQKLKNKFDIGDLLK